MSAISTNLIIITVGTFLSAIFQVGKKYIVTTFQLSQNKPKELAGTFVTGALYFAYNVFQISLGAPLHLIQQTISTTSSIELVVLMRCSLVFAGITMLFGPFLVLPPIKPIVLKKETFFKKMVKGAQKKETRYTTFAIFCVISLLQAFVVFSLWQLLYVEFKQELRLVLGVTVGYALVCLFYLVIMYSVMMKKDVVIKGINLLEQIRRNCVIRRRNKPPIHLLDNKHYVKIYLVLFVLAWIAAVALTVVVFVGDLNSPIWSTFGGLAQGIVIGFFVVQLLSVIVYTVFILNVAFNPVQVTDVVLADGTVVSTTKIRFVTVARSLDRVILLERDNRGDPDTVAIRDSMRRIVQSPDTMAAPWIKGVHQLTSDMDGVNGRVHQSNDEACMYLVCVGCDYSTVLADYFLTELRDTESLASAVACGVNEYKPGTWLNAASSIAPDISALIVRFEDDEQIDKLLKKASKRSVEQDEWILHLKSTTEQWQLTEVDSDKARRDWWSSVSDMTIDEALKLRIEERKQVRKKRLPMGIESSKEKMLEEMKREVHRLREVASTSTSMLQPFDGAVRGAVPDLGLLDYGPSEMPWRDGEPIVPFMPQPVSAVPPTVEPDVTKIQPVPTTSIDDIAATVDGLMHEAEQMQALIDEQGEQLDEIDARVIAGSQPIDTERASRVREEAWAKPVRDLRATGKDILEPSEKFVDEGEAAIDGWLPEAIPSEKGVVMRGAVMGGEGEWVDTNIMVPPERLQAIEMKPVGKIQLAEDEEEVTKIQLDEDEEEYWPSEEWSDEEQSEPESEPDVDKPVLPQGTTFQDLTLSQQELDLDVKPAKKLYDPSYLLRQRQAFDDSYVKHKDVQERLGELESILLLEELRQVEEKMKGEMEEKMREEKKEEERERREEEMTKREEKERERRKTEEEKRKRVDMERKRRKEDSARESIMTAVLQCKQLPDNQDVGVLVEYDRLWWRHVSDLQWSMRVLEEAQSFYESVTARSRFCWIEAWAFKLRNARYEIDGHHLTCDTPAVMAVGLDGVGPAWLSLGRRGVTGMSLSVKITSDVTLMSLCFLCPLDRGAVPPQQFPPSPRAHEVGWLSTGAFVTGGTIWGGGPSWKEGDLISASVVDSHILFSINGIPVGSCMEIDHVSSWILPCIAFWGVKEKLKMDLHVDSFDVSDSNSTRHVSLVQHVGNFNAPNDARREYDSLMASTIDGLHDEFLVEFLSTIRPGIAVLISSGLSHRDKHRILGVIGVFVQRLCSKEEPDIVANRVTEAGVSCKMLVIRAIIELVTSPTASSAAKSAFWASTIPHHLEDSDIIEAFFSAISQCLSCK